MDKFHAYCKEVYTFYNGLQEIFHKWRHKAEIKNYKLILPKVEEPVKELNDQLDNLRNQRDKVDFPTTNDFFIKNSATQIDSILKAADIQISILSGKSFDPLFLRNELYEIDIEKWFQRASAEIDTSFAEVSKAVGKEKVIKLIAESGKGTIVGSDKVTAHVNGFVERALSKIEDFTYLTDAQRDALKKKTQYKIDFSLAPGHVMRITPGEKTMYFDPEYHFSPTFLDFILSHDYCGHAFHDTLTNEIFSQERPEIYKTWYDDECDMFSCFGEGMSCYVEKMVPSFLGLSQDVVDYLHVRQKIWLPLRVILDMKINVQNIPVQEVVKYMRQFDFPEKFANYVIESIIFHNMGYMSVYYPSLMRMEELQKKHNILSFDLYQILITAGNMTMELFEGYLNEKLGKV